MLSEIMLDVAWYCTFAIFFMHVGVKISASLRAQRLIGRGGDFSNYRFLADKIAGELYNKPGIISKASTFSLAGVVVCVTMYFVLLIMGY